MRDVSVNALTLSGSSPAPATHGLYSDLIALALARRVPVFLDTYGPALDGIWGFWPTVIQLNRREAAIRLRQAERHRRRCGRLARDWHRRGVTCGIVTDGPNPVSIVYRGRRYRAIPPQVEVVNPIGSGDSLLAGLVDGWLDQLEPEPLFRHAVGFAVANAMVWDAGAIDPGEAQMGRTGRRRAAGRGRSPADELAHLTSAAFLVCFSRTSRPRSAPASP